MFSYGSVRKTDITQVFQAGRGLIQGLKWNITAERAGGTKVKANQP